MLKFWDEIRRRNLHRVTAAYAVVAWVLAQGAAIIFPTFDMPGWALKLLIIILVAGLPVLLLALWLAAPPPSESVGAERLHHTEWTLIGLLGLVLVATAAELIWSPFGTATSTPLATAQDASIAVLAFNNMSEDKNNEYFSEGISEELLNDLAQVKGLRVAGRTSSFSFRGKNVTIEDIGRALNVRTVLEGSVRRAGDRVRITAQLINAADGFHIWSADYDRQIADIFAVQDEISNAITRELTGKLLGKKETVADAAVPAPARPQINPEAYTAYLQGRFFMAKRNKDSMLRAVDFFKQAIKLEPDYADAHAALGRSYGLMFSNGQANNAAQLAFDENAIALRIDPDNMDGLTSKAGGVAGTWKWAEADADFRKLLALYPNSADTLHVYSNFLMFLDLYDLALKAERRAETLDPLAPIIKENIGDILYSQGRFDDAIVAYKASLTLDPNLMFSLLGLCASYSGTNRIGDAEGVLRDRIVPIDGKDGSNATLCKSAIAHGKGDNNELKKLSAIMVGHYSQGISPTLVAMPYAFAGDNTPAIEWFSKAYDQRDTQFLFERKDPLLPAKFTGDPRWQALLARPAFQEMAPVRAAIEARGTGG